MPGLKSAFIFAVKLTRTQYKMEKSKNKKPTLHDVKGRLLCFI